MALFIIGFILCALAIAGFIYHFIIFKKSRDILSINKKLKVIFNIQISLFTIACLMCGYGIVLMNKLNLDGGHIALLVIGCIIFGVSFFILFESFTIYFYKPELENKEKRIIKLLMYAMIPIAFISFFVSTEGYAPYLTYPLVNGINFSKNGVKFITCNDTHEGFTIAWYGLIMLTGAVIAYFVCDHHLYKEYKKHGIIDTMFVLVFLMGILGARIWYCAVLERDMSIFWQFQNGGLAIMGGALFGAVSGIAFILLFRRYINIRHAMDVILPCVLIAQAIGRWGNFFNHEVYGYATFEMSKVFLPTIIKNQMAVTFGGSTMYLPLFLIEFFSNLTGYFVIEYAYGKGVGKHASLGDRFFCYLIWYGLTRVILEPLRAGGFEYNASYITAWVMFGGGIAAIIGLHVYDYFRWGKRTFVLLDQTLVDNGKNPYIKRINNETVKN